MSEKSEVENTKKISFLKFRKEKKRKSLTKKIISAVIKCLILVLIILVISLVYQNRHDLTYEGFVQYVKDENVRGGKGDGFPVQILGSKAHQMEEFNGTVLSLSDTYLVTYNNSAKRIVNLSHSFNNPVVSISERRLLFYDINGHSYKIETLSGNVVEGKEEDSIVVGAIGQGGEFALVTRGEKGLADVTMHSKDGSKIFKWISYTYQVIDVAVSPDGKSFAVAAVKAQGGDLYSSVMVFKQGSQEAIASYESKGMVYFSLEYTSSDIITVVADDSIIFLNVTKNTAEKYDYNGKNIACFDSSYNDGTAIMISPYQDRKECTLVVFNENGKKMSEIDTKLDAVSVSIENNYVYTVAAGKAYEYRSSGELLRESEVGEDSVKIVSVGGKVYVTGASDIKEVNF